MQRAVRFRRQQSDGLDSPHVLDAEIFGTLSGLSETDRPGWYRIGSVGDCFVCMHGLTVWWHPETDRVQIERPPVFAEPTRRQTPPLRWDVAVKRPGYHHNAHAVAQPGYTYTYDGVDYDYKAAELMCTVQGGIDGWTWRSDGLPDID